MCHFNYALFEDCQLSHLRVLITIEKLLILSMCYLDKIYVEPFKPTVRYSDAWLF